MSLLSDVRVFVRRYLDYWGIGIGMSYLTTHDFEHCERIFTCVHNFFNWASSNIVLSSEEHEILEIAIYLHDLGCIISRKQHPLFTYLELTSSHGRKYFLRSLSKGNQDDREKLEMAAIIGALHDPYLLKSIIYQDIKLKIKHNESQVKRNLIEKFSLLKLNNLYNSKNIRLDLLGGLLSLFDALDDTQERILEDLILMFDSSIINYKYQNIILSSENISKEIYDRWYGTYQINGSRFYWLGIAQIQDIKIPINLNYILIQIRNFDFISSKYSRIHIINGLYKAICEGIYEDYVLCSEICEIYPTIKFPIEKIILGYKTNIFELDKECIKNNYSLFEKFIEEIIS